MKPIETALATPTLNITTTPVLGLFPSESCASNTNFGHHHNTCSEGISIKISIGIIRNHLPDTLSPFLELPRPWLWGAALLKLLCNGIFSFGVLSTGHILSYQIIIT
jgi:hypothetical protein